MHHSALEPAGRSRLFWWYAVLGLAWFIRYTTLGHVPPWQAPIWAGWFDQSRYLASAVAFAHGDLSMGAHWYPLGYALTAAPFVWLSPADPFIPLDLILYLITCEAFRRVALRFGVPPVVAIVCFAATTIVQTGLAGAWAQPWTSTLSAALIWWLIERTATVSERKSPVTRLAFLGWGALAGALPLVRPVDALVSATALLFVCPALVRRGRSAPSAVLAIGSGVAVVVGPYALLHLAIYGPHATPYMIAAARTGFVPRDLGWKAYVLLVHPEPWWPRSDAILKVLPWIVPGLAGMIAHAVLSERNRRSAATLLLATALPESALMLTYADLEPPGVWLFGNIHYFKWIMPIFGLGLILAWRMLRSGEGTGRLALVTLLLLLPLGVRITPVPVADDAPARMLLFRGDTRRAWDEAYFAPVTIRDTRGVMKNVGDFHQLPDAAGARAVAISRPFAARPRRSDPGEPVLRADEPPYARYGEKISFLGW